MTGQISVLEKELVGSRNERRTLSVLGATGSIGTSTLDLVRRNPDSFKIHALSAHSNVEELAKLAIEFGAECAVIGDEKLFKELQTLLSGTNTKPSAGINALEEAAGGPADLVMSALVGAAGLAPTLAALRAGINVALANKESLVCAGDLVMELAAKTGADILPVDSEHNAIFQVFDTRRPKDISRIILTASGGPFRTFDKEKMENITVRQALDHPNWTMGKKITIDSATMMNKGLELIEAYYLFPVDLSQIDVVVHPQSVVHSMVEYVDGSVLAQMGTPDMRIPISYALAWPSRLPTPAEKLDLLDVKRLDFEPVDDVRFPALGLSRMCLEKGEGRTIVLNAANEVAVEAFLSGRISFSAITSLVRSALEHADKENWRLQPQDFEGVMALDKTARHLAETLL